MGTQGKEILNGKTEKLRKGENVERGQRGREEECCSQVTDKETKVKRTMQGERERDMLALESRYSTLKSGEAPMQ